jgi:hypothetical protein|tara:strand:+ start:907 stop:1419 length:513 start_codon:yes stop_codon:yes gene_type:complete
MDANVEYNYSDSFYRYFILFIFIILYIYLKFINKKLTNDILYNKDTDKNVKCNPLELVVSSIFNPSESESQLKKCILTNNTDLLHNYGTELKKSISNNYNNTLEKCQIMVDDYDLNNDSINDPNITSSQADNIKMRIDNISGVITDISNNLESNIDKTKTILEDIISNIN